MAQTGKLQLTKYTPPPSELPIYQREDPAKISFFGRTNYEAALEEKKFVFGIKREDRAHHMYILGKSGVGKTKLLELLIRQDIAQGLGVCVIDPMGELVSSILDFVPKGRVNDVVLVNPSDTDFPVSFNPISSVESDVGHHVIGSFTEIFKKQLGEDWNSQMEHFLKMALLALISYPGSVILDIIKLTTDSKFREKVLNYNKDDEILHFWGESYLGWMQMYEKEAVAPLLNNIRQIALNPLLKGIFSNVENKIDLSKIIDENKILLVYLARGKMGEAASSFFGSLFISGLHRAGITRSLKNKKNSSGFYLYIDEFHELETSTFLSLFSEAGKCRINITVVNQYIKQTSKNVFDAMLGNAGTLIVFRLNGSDAVLLEKEMTPVLKAKDMINLGRQEFYAKMIIDGNTYDPFSAETLKVHQAVHQSYKKDIIANCRSLYS